MEENNIELRSEKTRNIIGTIPSVIIRSGIAIIFLVLLLFIFICWFIKVPDVTKCEIVGKNKNELILSSVKKIYTDDKLLCEIREGGALIFSDSIEVVSSVKTTGSKEVIYIVKTEMPDTIRKGKEIIIIDDYSNLTAELIKDNERLLYKLIPVLKNNT